MATDHVEKHWPHVAELLRTLEAINDVNAPASTGSSDIDGQAIVTAIKQFEISNGKAWRS